ncbi:MAG TPA: hypothetical protein VGA77_06340 [Propylenella sp.]
MRNSVAVWAQRLPVLAAALALQLTGPPAAAQDGAETFVRVVKREISGKTGEPVRSVEIFGDGAILLKDAAGEVGARARLAEADLLEIERLLADPEFAAATPVCGRPLGADLPEAELLVQHEWKTMILRLAPHCRLPPPADRLLSLIERAERKYLSAEGGG